MTLPKKQLKITKLIKRKVVKPVADDCDDLQEEVRQLEQKVKDKHTEWFQLQRNSYRRKPLPPKKEKQDNFIKPLRIILNNSTESLKRTLELFSMLTGMEVQSYVAEKYCCVVFHMQHASEHVMSHGLRIDLESGKKEISAMSLPLGFNLNGVMDNFDNVMTPECLCAIRKALVAYYDRLEQFNKLKHLVNIEAELFKVLDGSHIQVSMGVQVVEGEEENVFPVILILDYRLYDIRPKTYDIRDCEDIPELIGQCAVFKKKPLHEAFKEVFLREDGEYKLVRQWVCQPRPLRRRGRKRARPVNPHNDDTFRPEDCSDEDEDDDCYE